VLFYENDGKEADFWGTKERKERDNDFNGEKGEGLFLP
jgi:hypothetical protein